MSGNGTDFEYHPYARSGDYQVIHFSVATNVSTPQNTDGPVQRAVTWYGLDSKVAVLPLDDSKGLMVIRGGMQEAQSAKVIVGSVAGVKAQQRRTSLRRQ